MSVYRPLDVQFPASVSEFLQANPGYTQHYGKPGLSPEEAYFHLRVLSDWEELRPHIPRSSVTTLDIGCGIAGIDLLVHQHLKRARLTLVEKAERSQNGQTFNVLEAARQFLQSNGVPAKHVEAISAQAPDLFERLQKRRYDLIFSLRALGYMFPYDVYASVIPSLLRPRGRLIMDVHLMDPKTLCSKVDDTIYQRFVQAGFPSADQVIARLEAEVGPVTEIARRTTVVRLCVRRKATAGPRPPQS
jgi:hypothetical protein